MIADDNRFFSRINNGHRVMIIEKNEYLKHLLAKRWNGKVRIIIGIRR